MVCSPLLLVSLLFLVALLFFLCLAAAASSLDSVNGLINGPDKITSRTKEGFLSGSHQIIPSSLPATCFRKTRFEPRIAEFVVD